MHTLSHNYTYILHIIHGEIEKLINIVLSIIHMQTHIFHFCWCAGLLFALCCMCYVSFLHGFNHVQSLRSILTNSIEGRISCWNCILMIHPCRENVWITGIVSLHVPYFPIFSLPLTYITRITPGAHRWSGERRPVASAQAATSSCQCRRLVIQWLRLLMVNGNLIDNLSILIYWYYSPELLSSRLTGTFAKCSFPTAFSQSTFKTGWLIMPAFPVHHEIAHVGKAQNAHYWSPGEYYS